MLRPQTPIVSAAVVLFLSVASVASVAQAEAVRAASAEAASEVVEAASSENTTSSDDAAVSVPEREAEPKSSAPTEATPAPKSKAADSAEDASKDASTDKDANADEPAAAPKQNGPKVISGMSILGNQEAPKSLVLVPWKSSVLGDSMGIAAMLDDSKQPVDRDVFMRSLGYYEIRSEKTP